MQKANSSENLEAAMTAEQLIIALHDMRDELIRTSQMMKEYSLHLNSALSSDGIEKINELLAKYKFR